ncbi:MAG: RDD family protein [Candidatus Acidiferrum sp.]
MEEDFAFTIAIGRNAATREESQMVIDVSLPPAEDQGFALAPSATVAAEQEGLYPVASMDDRRIAGLVDAGCLLFAYGGFLTLFGSLGGQFTFSKLSAAVCVATFVIVYLQYFALFTVFGGTTPGMMLRGLQVASFSGEPPTPRQMLWRSVGYMLSAGTFFMGFLWAMWDEDALTWHDRLSRTYLCPAPTFADLDATHAAHSR